MTYFTDLTPHTYSDGFKEEGVLNIGWLGEGNPFPTGFVSTEFVSALSELCSRPIILHRGHHNCEFCGDAQGNGQIRAQHSNGNWYSAPTMVLHYVTEHKYRPPAEFIEAVLKGIAVTIEL